MKMNVPSATRKKKKLNYGKTALIGFGFMAVQIAWIIYNNYMPLILRGDNMLGGHPWTETAIGAVMVFDNIFGVVCQPLFGRLSDRTHTRFGKRTPYMMIGLPVCALLFIMIPRLTTLGALMTNVILFNFVMSTWRSPVVAMMPDATPSELRGEGNAVINIMGGVGVVLGTVAGKLFSVLLRTDDIQTLRNYVFLFGAVVMVLCLFVVVFVVREGDNRITKEESLKAKADYEKSRAPKKKKTGLRQIGLSRGETVSLIVILAALFFNSNATDSINTNFTTFAAKEMGFAEKDAALFVTLFAASTVAGAIPAGKLGQKFGRKKTIIVGWAGILALFLLFLVTKLPWLFYVAVVAGGVCIAFVTINTLPLVLEIGGQENIGTFTGLYYTATQSAAIVGPVVMGAIFDFTKKFTADGRANYWSLFIFCPVCFAIALICMIFVRHGETNTISEETIREIREED